MTSSGQMDAGIKTSCRIRITRRLIVLLMCFQQIRHLIQPQPLHFTLTGPDPPNTAGGYPYAKSYPQVCGADPPKTLLILVP
jgi:hypothetical protein